MLVTVVALALLLARLSAAAQPPAGAPAAAEAPPATGAPAAEKIWIPVDGHILLPRHPDVRGGAVGEFLGRIGLGVRP